MKQFLFALLLLFPGIMYAQYKTFVFGKYEYKSDCHYNRNDFITIKLDMQSLDAYPVQLMIGTEKEYNNFMRRLKFIKTKMAEWDSVCVANNIDKIDKMIEYKVGRKEEPMVWFGKYYNSSPLLCAYGRENGISKVIVHTGIVSSLTNDYIRCKGGVIIFYSPQDVDEMIKAFELANMQVYIDEKNKKVELLQ